MPIYLLTLFFTVSNHSKSTISGILSNSDGLSKYQFTDTTLPYPRWGYMQPDLGEDPVCGAMLYNGDLNDVQCDERTFFICERNVKNNISKEILT